MMNSTSNHFIEEFTLALEKTENSNFLIQNEINQLETFISSSNIPSRFPNKITGKYDNSTNSIFDGKALPLKEHFNKSFYEYNTLGKIDLKMNLINPQQYEKTVIEFSEYYEWLKELKQNKKQKKNSPTQNEQILMLHYMGFNFFKLENKLQLSKILCLIIDKNEKNVCTSLSHFDSAIKNKSNLTSILKRFQHKDFHEIKDQIEKDLEKLR